MTDKPQNEAQLLAWMQTRYTEMEIQHLQLLKSRYDNLQIAALIFICLWNVGLFIAYQANVLPADIAGIVTASVMVGGAFIWWNLQRLKRGIETRLKAEEQKMEDSGNSLSSIP